MFGRAIIRVAWLGGCLGALIDGTHHPGAGAHVTRLILVGKNLSLFNNPVHYHFRLGTVLLSPGMGLFSQLVAMPAMKL